MQRLKDIAAAVRDGMPRPRGRFVVAALVAGALAFSLYQDPPVRTVARGEMGLRENLFTGEVTRWRDGSVLAMIIRSTPAAQPIPGVWGPPMSLMRPS